MRATHIMALIIPQVTTRARDILIEESGAPKTHQGGEMRRTGLAYRKLILDSAANAFLSSSSRTAEACVNSRQMFSRSKWRTAVYLSMCNFRESSFPRKMLPGKIGEQDERMRCYLESSAGHVMQAETFWFLEDPWIIRIQISVKPDRRDCASFG